MNFVCISVSKIAVLHNDGSVTRSVPIPTHPAPAFRGRVRTRPAETRHAPSVGRTGRPAPSDRYHRDIRVSGTAAATDADADAVTSSATAPPAAGSAVVTRDTDRVTPTRTDTERRAHTGSHCCSTGSHVPCVRACVRVCVAATSSALLSTVRRWCACVCVCVSLARTLLSPSAPGGST